MPLSDVTVQAVTELDNKQLIIIRQPHCMLSCKRTIYFKSVFVTLTSASRPETFDKLFMASVRVRVDNFPGYPDRISLRDIPAGETAILINHTYQPADTPYHGSHAIYLWEGCTEQGIYINKIPEVMTRRHLSLRAYDENHFMIKADICEGAAAERLMSHFFNEPSVSYIHVHNAKQGCYACLAERVL